MLTLKGAITNIRVLCTAPVAQLDRATGYEPVGRAFESLRVRHTNKKALVERQGPFCLYGFYPDGLTQFPFDKRCLWRLLQRASMLAKPEGAYSHKASMIYRSESS